MIKSTTFDWGDTGYVSINIDTINHLIEWVPVGSVCLRDWKHSFFQVFQSLNPDKNRFKQIKWLNDLTEFEAAGLKHLKFLQSYVNMKARPYFPPIKVAFVKPKDLLGLAAMHGYSSQSNLCCARVNIKVFDTKEEALDWLNK